MREEKGNEKELTPSKEEREERTEGIKKWINHYTVDRKHPKTSKKGKRKKRNE